MAGDATNEYDFQKSFAIDNVVVNVVSIFIVLLVLLFTFQSVGMPILLIVVIQGAIWVNFSFPYFMGTNLYFMGYLIVSSIQMGANIDYAIVIATRFNELKDKMEHKQAMIETINFAFPTILTSGTIMTVSGILIGQMTSDAASWASASVWAEAPLSPSSSSSSFCLRSCSSAPASWTVPPLPCRSWWPAAAAMAVCGSTASCRARSTALWPVR